MRAGPVVVDVRLVMRATPGRPLWPWEHRSRGRASVQAEVVIHRFSSEHDCFLANCAGLHHAQAS